MKAATENNDKTKMSLIRSLYTWKALSIMSLISGAALFLFLSPLSPLYLERGVMGPLIQSLNHALFPSLSPENLNGIITGIIVFIFFLFIALMDLKIGFQLKNKTAARSQKLFFALISVGIFYYMLFVFFGLYEQEYQRFTDELYFWHSIVIFFYNALVTPLYTLSEYLPMDAIFSIGFLVITLCFPVLLFISGCSMILKGETVSSENNIKHSRLFRRFIFFIYYGPLLLFSLLVVLILYLTPIGFITLFIIMTLFFISGYNMILKETNNSSENKKKCSKACTYLILFSYSVPLFLLILLAIIIEIGIFLYVIPMELYQNWSWFCYELINSI